MQAIPAAVRTLIKSKVMVGADAPAIAMTVEGSPSGGIGDPTWGAWVKARDTAASFGRASFATMTNGKIIAAYARHNTTREIYLSSVDNVAALANVNSLAANEASFAATFPIDAGSLFNQDHQLGRAHVKRLANNTLLLICYDPGYNDKAALCKAYTSSSGNGGDWAETGTVFSVASPAKLGTFNTKLDDAGQIVQLDSGRILFCAGKGNAGTGGYSSYWLMGYHVFYSDDLGATWTDVPVNLSYTNSYDYIPYITSIGVFANCIVMVAGLGVATATYKSRFYYSTDEGATWTALDVFAYDAGLSETSFTLMDGMFCPGDGYNYLCIGFSTGSRIMRVSCDTTLSLTGQAPYERTSGNLWVEYLAAADSGARWSTNLSTVTPNGYNDMIVSYHNTTTDDIFVKVAVREDLPSTPIPFVSANISRELAALAQSASVEIVNCPYSNSLQVGMFSPESGVSPAWAGIILPGVKITLTAGYGANIIKVFEGYLDDLDIGRDARSATMGVQLRDLGSLLLDKCVTNAGARYLVYENQFAETIVADLLAKAGFTTMTLEVTGIKISRILFDRISYGEAIERILTLTGYEFIVDENNAAWFHKPNDRQPETEDTVVLAGTTPVDLLEYPVVTATIEVWSEAGGTGTQYALTTDYTVTQGTYNTPWKVTRVAGGTIGDGATVYVRYVYAAWVFTEGVDLISINYKYSRRDIFGEIVVTGQGEDKVISDDTTILNGTTYSNLDSYPIVTSSIEVWSGAGKTGTQYSVSTDYDVSAGDDTTPWRIKRTGAGIPDGATVYVSYVLDTDVVVTGKYTLSTPASKGVTVDEVLFVDLPELNTNAKCQACADQLGSDMLKKYREVEVQVVGVPWLQIGDCINVRETSTGISEIYRILSMSLILQKNGIFQNLRCYHYGYTP